jgi:hypothetical protein
MAAPNAGGDVSVGTIWQVGSAIAGGINSIFGGRGGLTSAQVDQFIAAGGSTPPLTGRPGRGGYIVRTYEYGGQEVSANTARAIARNYANAPPVAVPVPPPAASAPPPAASAPPPAASAPPPVATTPPSVEATLPPIPGLAIPTTLPPVGGFPWGSVIAEWAVGGGIGTSALGALIAGVLLWPRAAGRGSDLCRKTETGTWCPPVVTANPIPVPIPRPSAGGRRRGGRRGRTAAPPGTVPRPTSIPRPRVGTTPKVLTRTVVKTPPAVLENIQLGGPFSPPLVSPVPSTSSATRSSTQASTQTATAPASTPAATASPASTLTSALPLILGGLLSQVGPRHRVVNSPWSAPGASIAPVPLANPVTQLAPLTAGYVGAVSSAQDRNCNCSKTKKRSKKRCTNPVTSKRKSTRGGQRYITTTRRIKCQA